MNPKGDCFEVAGGIILGCGLVDPPAIALRHARVVHALVNGQGPLRGVRFAHAWVEIDGTVFDYSNGKHLEMDVAAYYIIGHVHPSTPREYARYSRTEFREKILETGHWGPWDLKGDL